MHNESRVIYSRCQLATSWANKSEREGKTEGHGEKVHNLWVWNDEAIRTDQLEDKAKRQAFSTPAPRVPHFSLICPHCFDLGSFLSFFFFSAATSAVHSIILQAYLSAVLPHSQPSLFSATTWRSSMFSSHRVSESVSPPTPAVGAQPPSCQMMLRVALPLSSLSIQPSLVFPLSSLPHIHACI